MNITMIGCGYVGLVTGVCFADLGHNVFCVDNDKKKIASLRKSKLTLYEPGLKEMFRRNVGKGRIAFSTSIKEGVLKSDIIFICVGTPSKENGEPDLLSLERVSQEIARNLDSYRLIVEKSTVPVDTGEWIKKTIEIYLSHDSKKRNIEFDVASNPEFLREGSALRDFMKPDRIVIGAQSKRAKDILRALYKPIQAPIVATDIKSAEIIKHASNSFLAAKISFINAVSDICERAGADIDEVARGMGLDKRIGAGFLKAGAGFGGSCFPKDLSAFIYIAGRLGYDFKFLREVQRINESQKNKIVEKISKLIWNIPGKTISVWGLSFKPDTDDIRNSAAIDIIKKLLGHGASIRAYDPKAAENARKVLKGKITYCRDAYEAAKGGDCLVVLTEWNEFKDVDLKKLKKLLKYAAVIDGRNIFDPKEMRDNGFMYVGVGRKG